MSTERPPSIDRLSIEYRPTVDRLSTECRPLYRPISRSTLPTVNKIPLALRYGLPSCILHECQNYLAGAVVWEGARKIYFSRLSPSPAPRAIIPDARPLGTLKIKIPVTVRRGISKRSHEKIGDCEQSSLGSITLVLSVLLLRKPMNAYFDHIV